MKVHRRFDVVEVLPDARERVACRECGETTVLDTIKRSRRRSGFDVAKAAEVLRLTAKDRSKRGGVYGRCPTCEKRARLDAPPGETEAERKAGVRARIDALNRRPAGRTR